MMLKMIILETSQTTAEVLQPTIAQVLARYGDHFDLFDSDLTHRSGKTEGTASLLAHKQSLAFPEELLASVTVDAETFRSFITDKLSQRPGLAVKAPRLLAHVQDPGLQTKIAEHCIWQEPKDALFCIDDLAPYVDPERIKNLIEKYLMRLDPEECTVDMVAKCLGGGYTNKKVLRELAQKAMNGCSSAWRGGHDQFDVDLRGYDKLPEGKALRFQSHLKNLERLDSLVDYGVLTWDEIQQNLFDRIRRPTAFDDLALRFNQSSMSGGEAYEMLCELVYTRRIPMTTEELITFANTAPPDVK